MKTIFKGLLFFFVMSLSQDVSAQAYQAAIGARLGTSFTASYKMFISERNALEGIVGIDRTSVGNGIFRVSSTSLVVGAFYQIHNDFNFEGQGFQWYYGFGGLVYLGDATGIVPSGIVGVEYTLPDNPVNFFIDVSPGLYLGNGGSDFDISGFIGARYVLR